MNDDKIKILTKVSFSVDYQKESHDIYIEFSSFDTLNQLKNHLFTILKFNIRGDEISDLYVNFQGTKIKLFDIKNFYFHLSNSVILNEQLQLEIDFQAKEEIREFDFDIKGEKILDINNHNSNRPSNTIYDTFTNAEVSCRFCRKSSKDEYYLKKCGPFYGPFKDGDKFNFVHENCVLWAPNVFLDHLGKLKNVNKEVKRSKKIECSFCREYGASTCCNFPECFKNYHYLCSVSDRCEMNWIEYLLYCKKHSKNAPHEFSNFNIERLIDIERKTNDSREAVCYVCFSGLDEDKLIICDECNVAYHSYCHDPVVKESVGNENVKWYCRNCQDKN